MGAVAAREALNWLLWPAIMTTELNTPEIRRPWCAALVRGTEVVMQSICVVRGVAGLGRQGDLKLGGHPARVLNLDVPLFNQLVLSGD